MYIPIKTKIINFLLLSSTLDLALYIESIWVFFPALPQQSVQVHSTYSTSLSSLHDHSFQLFVVKGLVLLPLIKESPPCIHTCLNTLVASLLIHLRLDLLHLLLHFIL
jgi:hypothetical protein